MNAPEDFSDLYTSLSILYSQEPPDVPVPDAALSPYLLAARWQSRDSAQAAARIEGASHTQKGKMDRCPEAGEC